MKEVYKKVDAMFTEQVKELVKEYVPKLGTRSPVFAGSCAILLIVHGGYLYIVNVGDSRAVICNKVPSGLYEAKALSIDHSCTNEREVRRVKQLSPASMPISGTQFGVGSLYHCLLNLHCVFAPIRGSHSLILCYSRA